MQYRLDERTGNSISIIGFGCMRFPRGVGGIDTQKVERLILRAIEAGVNYFDTAYLYSGSEAALGTVLSKNNMRDNVFIATKLPIANCHAYADFDKFFDIQLAALKTDYIDYYLMHNINSLKQWDESRTIPSPMPILNSSKAMREIYFASSGVDSENKY